MSIESNAEGVVSCRYYLSIAGLSVRGAALLSSQQLCALAADDAALNFEMIDWREHEPPRWQRRRRREWCAERDVLDRQRADLRRRARYFF